MNRRVKLSELPISKKLKGLFTFGTDDENRSVKIPLEFIDEVTEEAKKKTTDAANATEAANAATEACKEATAANKAATARANTSANNADAATANATDAANAANNAASKFNDTIVQETGDSTEKVMSQKASIDYVNSKIASLVDSAPETLDTLKELSAALNDDKDFGANVLKVIDGCAKKEDIKSTEEIVRETFTDSENNYFHNTLYIAGDDISSNPSSIYTIVVEPLNEVVTTFIENILFNHLVFKVKINGIESVLEYYLVKPSNFNGKYVLTEINFSPFVDGIQFDYSSYTNKVTEESYVYPVEKIVVNTDLVDFVNKRNLSNYAYSKQEVDESFAKTDVVIRKIVEDGYKKNEYPDYPLEVSVDENGDFSGFVRMKATASQKIFKTIDKVTDSGLPLAKRLLNSDFYISVDNDIINRVYINYASSVSDDRDVYYSDGYFYFTTNENGIVDQQMFSETYTNEKTIDLFSRHNAEDFDLEFEQIKLTGKKLLSEVFYWDAFDAKNGIARLGTWEYDDDYQWKDSVMSATKVAIDYQISDLYIKGFPKHFVGYIKCYEYNGNYGLTRIYYIVSEKLKSQSVSYIQTLFNPTVTIPNMFGPFIDMQSEPVLYEATDAANVDLSEYVKKNSISSFLDNYDKYISTLSGGKDNVIQGRAVTTGNVFIKYYNDNIYDSPNSLMINRNVFSFESNTTSFTIDRSKSSLIKIVLENADKLQDGTEMFKDCVNLISIENDMFYIMTYSNKMFYNCKKLKTVDLSGLALSDEEDAADKMFYGCDSLEEILYVKNGTRADYTVNKIITELNADNVAGHNSWHYDDDTFSIKP